MLMTGNYRCITGGTPIAMREAVVGDIATAREVYDCVAAIVRALGAAAGDLVPFEKYAAAAEQLTAPSSAARAIAAGAPAIERVDRLIASIGRRLGITHPAIETTVAVVDAALARNRLRVA
jgi:hypothetical protein